MEYNLENTIASGENVKNVALFLPQKKESAVDVVINNIKRLLITKQLLPGDRLPNEIELAKKLAISRGSVREAMKIFSAFGIIEIRQGDGTYVAQSIGNVLFDPLLFSLILSQPDVKELAEFRELMEMEVINLVVNNAGDDDIKKIQEVYSEMEEQVNKTASNGALLAQLDMKFHYTVCSATRNKLVEKVYAFILEFFRPSIEKTHENQINGVYALKIHKEILDAIIERDIKKGRMAVGNSVKTWKELILEEHNSDIK